MNLNYAECERRVLLSEGGYTNNPRDPGGPTNWGITLEDARLHWKPDATAEDVRAMPKAVAEQIYKTKYWDALDGDALPSGVDYTVFDYGVNSGIGRSGRVLRAVLGLDQHDWHVDSDVLTRLADVDPVHVVDAINTERMAFLMGLSTWPTFGGGWGRRVVSVKQFSEHLAKDNPPPAGSVQAPAHPDVPPTGKAPGDDHPVDIPSIWVPGWLKRPQDANVEPSSPSALPQGSPPVRSPEAPATPVAPAPQAPPQPPTGRWWRNPWTALGLGGTGLYEALEQVNQYAEQIAQAKTNWANLNLNGAVSWAFYHPVVFMPVVVVIGAAWIYDEHRKIQRLLKAQTQ